MSDKKNSLKEVVQEVVLCGLSRAVFFNRRRFSENLDFSLKTTDTEFQLSKYFPILGKEVNSLGLHFKAEEKMKTAQP